MKTNYRSLYLGDLLIFTALAVPGLNGLLLECLLGADVLSATAENFSVAVGLCGLLGVMGMAFSYFRLTSAESRSKVIISFWVKALAVLWLSYLAITVSNTVFLIAAVDFVGAVVFLLALYKN